MKVNRQQLIHRLAHLETKVLDPVLFAASDDDDNDSPSLLKPAIAAGGGLALAGGGALAHQGVMDRLSGLRATVPGFAQKSRLAQYGAAAGDLGGDALAKAGDLFSAAGKAGAGLLDKLRFDSQTEVLTRRLVSLEAVLDGKIELGAREKISEAGKKVAEAGRKIGKKVEEAGKEAGKKATEAGAEAGRHVSEHRKAYAGAGIAAGLGGSALILAHGVHKAKQMRDWREQAGEGDLLHVDKDLLIDRHGAMYPGNHPKVAKSKITKLS
jgi:ElaB/YqjD/DUF883 family membrane-anchored ribosome-binding protein